eukprot:925233-Pyramimonas_sp.AAC.1
MFPVCKSVFGVGFNVCKGTHASPSADLFAPAWAVPLVKEEQATMLMGSETIKVWCGFYATDPPNCLSLTHMKERGDAPSKSFTFDIVLRYLTVKPHHHDAADNTDGEPLKLTRAAYPGEVTAKAQKGKGKGGASAIMQFRESAGLAQALKDLKDAKAPTPTGGEAESTSTASSTKTVGIKHLLK